MQIRFYIKEGSSKGIGTLYTQITNNYGKTRFYFSDVKIAKSYWNQKNEEVKKSCEGYSEINQKISDIRTKINKIIIHYTNENDGMFPNEETIKKLLNKEFRDKEIISDSDKLKSFWGFLEHFTNQSINGVRKNSDDNSIAPNTIKSYITLRNLLREFEDYSKIKITFEKIDYEFYQDFLEYMQTIKVLKKNTIGKYIKTLKTVLREALDNDYHVNLKFTSRRFSAPSELTTATYLKESELDEMYSLDLKNKPSLERVRDLFILSCNAGGIRFSDTDKISTKNIVTDPINPNDLYFRITPKKTNSEINIPLNDKVNQILEKYNHELPKPISNQKTNEYLKEICKLIPSLNETIEVKSTTGGKKVVTNKPRWELVSTHTARRSFATNSYNKGHRKEDIMAITGHKTDKDFDNYIRLTPMDKARSFKLHEDSKNNKLKVI